MSVHRENLLRRIACVDVGGGALCAALASLAEPVSTDDGAHRGAQISPPPRGDELSDACVCM